jgi:hypothetical protein
MARELLLGMKGGAVDPREHLAAGVAPPVRTGGGEQLEGLDPLGGRGVRPAAQVREGAVRVERNGLQVTVGGGHEVVDELDLVGLVLVDEALAGRRDG